MSKKKEVKTTKAKVLNKELSNSIKPSITEIERFVCFLGKRVDCEIPDNLIVTIQEIGKTTKGQFASETVPNHFENTTKPLNHICISSNHLKDTPYETIGHEFGHLYNYLKGIKDCSSNQYHNKNFKAIAELLHLKVEKGKRGFAYTSETPEFKEMLKEFKPDENAFHVFQCQKNSEKKARNGNILFMCECGTKLRTAKKPFHAVCQDCNTEFVEQ